MWAFAVFASAVFWRKLLKKAISSPNPPQHLQNHHFKTRIIHLAKVRGEAYPASRRDDRPRRRGIMSVAVGLGDMDMMALCADRQMTDVQAGLKFEGRK